MIPRLSKDSPPGHVKQGAPYEIPKLIMAVSEAQQ